MKKYILLLTIAATLLLITCKPPFEVGLGEKVDLDNPEISVTSHQNGEYIKGETTISGTYTDDFGVQDVRVSLDGGITFLEAEISDGTWSIAIDTSDYTDGSVEIILLITDNSGKSLEKRLLLYFDNTPPVVVVNQPVQYAFSTFNGDLVIKGDASDTLGVKNVKLSVEDSEGTVLVDEDDAEGTNSWSYTFSSADYVGDRETLKFSVKVTDNAGNSSLKLYHYDDIYNLNGAPVSVEDVRKILEGQTIEGINLSSENLEQIALDYLSVQFDQDTDLPTFIISNPDAEAAAEENVLPGNAVALGMAVDDDGINTDSVEVKIDDGEWTGIDETSGSGLSVRFEHDLSDLTDGTHTIMFRAKDVYGVLGTSSAVSFLIDRGAPSITLTYPDQGDYVNSRSFSCTGTAVDGDSVAGVEVSLDGGITYSAASLSGTDWTFPVSIDSDGTVSIKIRALDGTGKTAYYNLQVVVDTQAPQISFIDPAKSSTVNGEVHLKGTTSDNSGITSVELKLGSSDPWIDMEGLYNWDYKFDSQSYTNSTHAEESPPGSGVWKLTIQARAADSAENVGSAAEYFLYIDNDTDKPTVNIVSPPDGESLGGAVLVTGTAFDDDAVFRIEMQADVNGDGDFTDQFDLNSDSDYADFLEDEGTWYTLNGTTLWDVQLNNSGELYHVEPGHQGNVTLRVRAVDTKDGSAPDVVGNYQELAIRFDDTIPRVENISHASGDYVSRSVLLTADILDDDEVSSIQISYDGGISYEEIINDPVRVTQNSPDDFDLHVSVDTEAYIPSSGVLYFRIKVIDNTNYQVLHYINFSVDNTYPSGAYTGDSQDIYGSGASSRLQGTATDTGTVNGIQKIELYLMRGGAVLSPAGGADGTATETDFGTTTGPYPDDSSYIISINDHNELGDDGGGNGDNDGYDESIVLSGGDYNWWASFDSTLIDDGTLDIHYVVYDNAFNSVHYSESGFIKNHKPAFLNVVTGTDLNLNGSTTDTGERNTYLPADLPATGFTAVNNVLYIELNAQAGGNTPVSYSLKKDGADPELITAGNSVLIDTSTGYSEGTASFTAQIIDNVGIVTEEIIEVEIDNTDDEDPVLTMNPLSQSSVKGYGTDVLDGHLEEENDSLFDGIDPDVSGTVIFDGTASDNQRIALIQVQITGYDAGGGEGLAHTVAQWDDVTDTLISLDGAFTITSQSLTETGGHQIQWEYEWNSADISNTAALNVTALFSITDGAARTFSDDIGLDVVPYITSIDTTLSDAFGYDFARSAKGYYSVKHGETVTINGFNLNPQASGADSDVRLSIDPDAQDTGAKQGEPLTYSNVAADYISVDVTVNAAGSGYLTVITSGISTTNNINNNGSSQNTLDSSIHSSLNDDCFLSLWEYTDVSASVSGASHAEYPSMTVNGDTPAFAYVNNSEGYGQARYLLGTTEKEIYNNWDLFTYTAIDFNESGSHGVLYDINVVNGNYGDYNSGNYGGILTSFYYDVPAHGWNPGARYFWDNCIWLDNLVDTDAPQTTAVLGRYQYPDLYLTGTDAETSVYYSTYDKLENRIIFRTYRVGTDAAIEGTTGGRINDEGTALYTDIPQYNRNGTFPPFNGTNNNNQRFINSGTAGKNPEAADGAAVTFFTPTGSFSDHTAVAATSGGTALLVYYDESGTGSLLYRYNETPENSGTWSSAKELDTACGAEYIDAQVDSAGRVHIAYYDSYDGNVSYIRMDSYVPPDTVTAVTVDSYLIVGDKLSLALDAGNTPYIAYKGIGNSARTAWLTAGSPLDGVDSAGRFNGNWEVQTLPVQMEDSDSNRFGVGVRSSDSMPVTGYTEDGLKYQRLLDNLVN